MPEKAIGQRIKILIKTLKLSSRAFSASIDVPDATTRNYIDGRSKPSAEYLEKIVRRYAHINPMWLLAGEGEATNQAAEPAAPHQKNSGGNNIGQNTGTGTVTQTHSQGSSSELQHLLDAARRENELLKSQLGDKDRIIQLLEMQLKK